MQAERGEESQRRTSWDTRADRPVRARARLANVLARWWCGNLK